MEATSQPVTQPLSDVDRKILGTMDKLGWGVTVSKLSEYADVDPDSVQSSLNWLSEQGMVEAHEHPDFGWLCWYRTEQSSASVCPICGKRCCNARGLAIHKARAHSAGQKKEQVWVDRSEGPLELEPEASDRMTMDLTPKSISFVQDLISRFATLPGAKISVTVEFSKGVDA